jgi:hypothetical protein
VNLEHGEQVAVELNFPWIFDLSKPGQVQVIRTVENARLRNGFDRMKCFCGAHSLERQ